MNRKGITYYLPNILAERHAIDDCGSLTNSEEQQIRMARIISDNGRGPNEHDLSGIHEQDERVRPQGKPDDIFKGRAGETIAF